MHPMQQLLEQTRDHTPNGITSIYAAYNKIHDGLDLLNLMKTEKKAELIRKYGKDGYESRVRQFKDSIMGNGIALIFEVDNHVSDERLKREWRSVIQDGLAAKLEMSFQLFI